jgi:hypothetical protein
LKDTDYVVKYHSDSLYLPDDGRPAEMGMRIVGTFANHPVRVAANCEAIKEVLEKL